MWIKVFLLAVAPLACIGADVGRLELDSIVRDSFFVFKSFSIFKDSPVDFERWKDEAFEKLSSDYTQSEISSFFSPSAFSERSIELIQSGRISDSISASLPDIEFRSVLLAYFNSFVQTLDQYARIDSPEEALKGKRQLDSVWHGFGIIWDSENLSKKSLSIEGIIPSSSASKTDLRPGDQVLAVSAGGELIHDFDSIRDLISKSESVTFHLCGGRSFYLTKETIKLENENFWFIEGDTVFVICKVINDLSPKILRQAAEKAKALGSKLVIDLRDNSGGKTESAILMAGYLLNSFNIGLQMRATDTNGRIYTSPILSPTAIRFDGKVEVHVNSNTASAAELLMLALSNRDNTTIFGGPTYGKHATQTLVELKSGYQFRYTASEFFKFPY